MTDLLKLAFSIKVKEFIELQKLLLFSDFLGCFYVFQNNYTKIF